ncbi:MAG: low molecular weight phosphotyrosine protein phosphatase [Myxococcales bacterium]|nr:low molecular weight phosphotyrosine protein phosphatase [Myxococcales bacterium]
MAKGLFEAKVRAAGLSGEIHIDSAGTSSYHVGERPDPGSIEVAARVGIDIREDRSRQFVSADFDRFDYLIAMDRSNQQNMARLRPSESSRVTLIRSYGGPDDSLDVPDPWGGGIGGFERVYEILDAATAGLLAQIREEHGL